MSPMYGFNGAVAEWLASRGDMDMIPKDGYAVSQYATATDPMNATAVSDAMLIDELRFDAAKSIRTSTIILASFNTLAAFATAVGILFDGYIRERRNRVWSKLKRRNIWLNLVPPYDVFPLVLSLGIAVQGIAFAIAQSQGLEALVGQGCTAASQAVLPTLFLVPSIQLVFGVEMLLRGLRKTTPFDPRGKWEVPVCLTLVVLFTVASVLVSIFDPASDFCFTDLFWFVAHWSVGIFALLTAVASAILISAVAIFVRLRCSTKTDETERIAASRMVYYLALAVISNAFMIPFFFTLAFGNMDSGDDSAENLSMVAAVVANVSGLMTGCLYLFLKSNRSWIIGGRGKAGKTDTDEIKAGTRRSGGSEPDYVVHMMQPVTRPNVLRRVDSETKLIGGDGGEGGDGDARALTSPSSVRSNGIYPSLAISVPQPLPPVQISVTSPERRHARKTSYSLFPSRLGNSSNEVGGKMFSTLLPTATYSPENLSAETLTLMPPPPIGGGLPFGFHRHRRDSSMVSSATVQIGLRLSSTDDIMPIGNVALAGNESVYDLHSPNEPAPGAGAGPKRPSPLRTVDLPSPRSGDDRADGDEAVADEKSAPCPRMKTLPPVPSHGIVVDESEYETESELELLMEEAAAEGSPETPRESLQPAVTLSPTVYKPESPKKPSRTPSPNVATGLASPQAAKLSFIRSPPPRRNPADSPAPVEGMADWI